MRCSSRSNISCDLLCVEISAKIQVALSTASITNLTKSKDT